MKYDLNTVVTKASGEVIDRVADTPLTVRDCLDIVLDSQPVDLDRGSGDYRPRPATVKEIRDRMAIHAKFPKPGDEDQSIDLTVEEVTLIQTAALNSLTVPVLKFLIGYLDGGGA